MTLAIATAGTASAAQYRYYRFNPTSTLGDGNLVQVSEFKFFSSGVRVVPLLPTSTPVAGDGSVTNVSGEGSSPGAESPPNLIDDNTGTKWLHFGGSGVDRSVVFDFGTATPPVIDSYTYVTAQGGATINGENSRNPDSWTLEGSSDGSTWDVLDVRSNISPPLAATTEITPAFVIPATIGPVITTFSALPIVMLNGSTTDLEWVTDFTDTVTLSPGGPPDLPTDGFETVTPPFTAGLVTDTTYTLEADSASAAPVTSTLKVRTVPGGTVTGQYVRFTPVSTVGGDIQIADIRFYKTVEGNEEEVIPDTCTYTDGTGGVGGESPDQMRDGNAGTKWFSGTLRPVIFTFPGEVSIESYAFVLGGDAGGYPGRNPRKWKMEISDDNFTWDTIEDFTAFDYPMPAVDNAFVPFPLPGYQIQSPPEILAFHVERDTSLPGDPLYFTWNTIGGDTVTLAPASGDDQPAAGSLEFIPTEDATYTLTVTNTTGSVSKSLSFDMIDPPTGTIAYPDFAAAGDELVLLGDATLVNDSVKITEPADTVRLRLTPDLTGKRGVAWYDQRVALGGGFDTTFGLQLTCEHRGYGAEGLGFMIQNTAEGLASDPQDNGPATNALTVKFSTWDNAAVAPETLNEARINIFAGATKIHNVNLRDFPAIALRGQAFGTLTGPLTATPYAVRVVYVPGDLDVYFEGVQVITDLDVDLGSIGAIDPAGTAYVGFVARTGGWDQASDITSWAMTSTSLAAPLKMLASTINPQAGTASFTWESIPGTEYRITSSTDLLDWSTIVEQDIPATTAVTEESITFIPGTKAFFRIEEEPAP